MLAYDSEDVDDTCVLCLWARRHFGREVKAPAC